MLVVTGFVELHNDHPGERILPCEVVADHRAEVMIWVDVVWHLCVWDFKFFLREPYLLDPVPPVVCTVVVPSRAWRCSETDHACLYVSDSDLGFSFLAAGCNVGTGHLSSLAFWIVWLQVHEWVVVGDGNVWWDVGT